MRNLSNSLRFRLYTIFGLLALLIVIFAEITSHSADRNAIVNDQGNVASAQRTNAYILITLMDQYIEADANTRANLDLFITEEQKSLEQYEDALRYGDESLQALPLTNVNLLSLLDTVDEKVIQLDQAVDDFLAADRADWENHLQDVTLKGTALASYAERLIAGIDALADYEQELENTLKDLLTALMIGALLIASWIIILTVRSVNQLANAAQAFADGNFQARAPVNVMNEISQVGQTFNSMADRINQLVQSLEKQVAAAQTAQARAEQSDQVKSAFLASMSHELRTPLNAIINFSKFVLRGVMGPINERQTEALTRVVQSGVHLLNLINDVLDISKIESGSLNLLIETDINVAQIIRETCKTAESLLEGKAVVLESAIASDIPLMTIDQKRFRQIMNNILSNACKFTETGSIKVNAHYEDGYLEIAVADSGPGIAPQDYDSVFEPFRQTETGLRQGMGTGLGMPISKSLAEALGGRLWFESARGKGSTFFVSLPVKIQEPAAVLV